ncbi:MAG TPA: M48 family metallopeptidase [Dehalococcoidia bacterium]|nr:M48 family metallopeptidase [Dehalococcoidia bacterium]
MLNAITVEINGIGPVLFERSKRARHVNISVKPFKGVRVAVPDRVSFNKAEAFVRTKIDWIKKQSEKMKQYEKEYNFTSGANDDIDKAEAKSMLTGRLKYLAKNKDLFITEYLFEIKGRDGVVVPVKTTST